MKENTLHMFDSLLLNLDANYADWLSNISFNDKEHIISVCKNKEDIDTIAKYITDNVKCNDNPGWIHFIKTLDNNWKKTSDLFHPSDLKYVTSTAICFIKIDDSSEYKYHPENSIIIKEDNTFEIQFQKIYNDYIPPHISKFNVLTSSYDNDCLNTIVGCINHKAEPKGFCHSKPNKRLEGMTNKHFQNSLSFIVCIDSGKDVNIKMFINGKLQLTGVPLEADGKRAVNILCDYMYKKYNIKMSIESYTTVMINTCYDLKFSINREILYDILINRYNLITVFDTEGYPGVRVHYFYNKNSVLTDSEGQCICEELCDGNGEGESCKRISVAIFQSGKVIIAGGCSNLEPIESAYRFINSIMKDIQLDIQKELINNNQTGRIIRNRRQVKLTKIKLEKHKIDNFELYRKLCLLCSSTLK
jgi:TATA-box binding protein (TBP) (component of TFIID and TFIIIB)